MSKVGLLTSPRPPLAVSPISVTANHSSQLSPETLGLPCPDCLVFLTILIQFSGYLVGSTFRVHPKCDCFSLLHFNTPGQVTIISGQGSLLQYLFSHCPAARLVET